MLEVHLKLDVVHRLDRPEKRERTVNMWIVAVGGKSVMKQTCHCYRLELSAAAQSSVIDGRASFLETPTLNPWEDSSEE